MRTAFFCALFLVVVGVVGVWAFSPARACNVCGEDCCPKTKNCSCLHTDSCSCKPENPTRGE